MVITPKALAERAKLSFYYRTRSAKRLFSNLGKHLHRTSSVQRKSILEIDLSCNNLTDLLRIENDAIWRASPNRTVAVESLNTVIASAGTKNKIALELSLSERHFETSAIAFGRFHDCVADPASIRIVTKNGELILETTTVHDLIDPHYRDANHLIRRGRTIYQLKKKNEYIDSDVIFAFNSFSLSYGHYLLTSLPLIFSLLDDIKRGSLKIVVPAGYPRWMQDHLLELGLEEKHFLVLGNAAYRFRSAIASNILDARNTRAPNPGSLPFVAQLLNQIENAPTSHRKLYVKRSGTTDLSSRTINNEVELIEELEALGFHVIEPTAMSFREQASAFRQASVIVSPHGSTLANLIFCRPGTQVLDLMPDDWVGVRGNSIRDVWALRMCALAQVEYSVLLCPSQITSRHRSGNPRIAYNVVISDLLISLRNSLRGGPA